MPFLTGLVLLVIGLLACFFGKRLYRIILALSGLVVGYYVAWGVVVDQTSLIVVVGSVVVGLIVAAVFWSLYKFAYVLFGLFLGLALAALVGKAFNLDGVVLVVIVVVLGLIGAVIGNMLGDLMIRLSTAFAGATQAVGGVAALGAAVGISLPLVDPTHGAIYPDSIAGVFTIVLVGVLGAVGYFYQTQNDRGAVI